MILLVAAGGAAGALARYGLSGWIHGLVDTTFPLGTLVVNAVGSFAMGVFLSFFEGTAMTPEVRSMVTIGFLGAFTTFSTFSYETVMLLEGGEWGRGAVYLVGNLALGLAGVVAGFALASLALQTRG